MKIKPEDLKVLGPDMFIVMNLKDYEEFVAKYGDNPKVKTTEPERLWQITYTLLTDTLLKSISLHTTDVFKATEYEAVNAYRDFISSQQDFDKAHNDRAHINQKLYYKQDGEWVWYKDVNIKKI